MSFLSSFNSRASVNYWLAIQGSNDFARGKRREDEEEAVHHSNELRRRFVDYRLMT